MELFLIGHDYKYAAEQIMLMLFPGENPVYPEKAETDLWAKISLSRGEKNTTAVCTLSYGGKLFCGRAVYSKSEARNSVEENSLDGRIIKLCFYRAGVRALGKKPVWGAQTGVRPGKLMAKLLQSEKSGKKALREFIRLYDVSPDRAELCLQTATLTQKVRGDLGKNDVCLYLGIPFCPTRCAYCSFVSQSTEKSMKLIAPFLDCLKKEIAATARMVRRCGMRIISVYFGGGTPTTLSAPQLEDICSLMESEFDLSACGEFTVEAGRPDTITAEKLEVLKRHGVTRVSVNPQTMSDKVLQSIGRKHSAAEVYSALQKVRDAGGFEVNMDLIAGLPDDSVSGFRDTLEKVLALSPENITVHTLALKKGSRITLEGTLIPSAEEVGEMLGYAAARLTQEGYMPYYLYRQKYMSGGFENVGWAKPGTENLYNICIMEELCSIIAMGGGASTKIVYPTGEMRRFFAPKYPLEYINGIDKICDDKNKIQEEYHVLQS